LQLWNKRRKKKGTKKNKKENTSRRGRKHSAKAGRKSVLGKHCAPRIHDLEREMGDIKAKKEDIGKHKHKHRQPRQSREMNTTMAWP